MSIIPIVSAARHAAILRSLWRVSPMALPGLAKRWHVCLILFPAPATLQFHPGLRHADSVFPV